MTRKEFEEFLSSSPYDLDVSRFPVDWERYAWPGHYKDSTVQVAWEVLAEAKERKKKRENTT